jgi:hypothetical protein
MVPIVSISTAAGAAYSASVQGPCEHLIAASGVRARDRVLVFGYDVLDHLVGLARSGVKSALGVYGGYRYRPHDPVDVVWFTTVCDIDAEVIRLLGAIGSPRLVAVELMLPSEFGQLRRLLWRLRAIGLTDTSYYKAGARFILTAWRSAARGQDDAPSTGAVIPMLRPVRGR